MSWQDILEDRVSSTNRLSPDDAVILYSQAPLHALSRAANKVRKQMNGSKEVTYLIDRNINYTNICNINCQFC